MFIHVHCPYPTARFGASLTMGRVLHRSVATMYFFARLLFKPFGLIRPSLTTSQYECNNLASKSNPDSVKLPTHALSFIGGIFPHRAAEGVIPEARRVPFIRRPLFPPGAWSIARPADGGAKGGFLPQTDRGAGEQSESQERQRANVKVEWPRRPRLPPNYGLIVNQSLVTGLGSGKGSLYRVRQKGFS